MKETTLIKVDLKPRMKVQWTGDTVDNEHLFKKKSKICCIYEKPKTHPDDSSSSCSSDSDGGNNYDKYPRH